MIRGFKSKLRLFNQDPTESKNLFATVKEDDKHGFQHIKLLDKPPPAPPDRLREQQEILLDRLHAGSNRSKSGKKADVKIENSRNQRESETRPNRKADDVTGGSKIAVQVDVETNHLNDAATAAAAADADSITCSINEDEKPEEEEEEEKKDEEDEDSSDSRDDLPESDRPHFFPKLEHAESESNNSSEDADKITPIGHSEASRPPTGNVAFGFCKDPPRRCQSQRENRIVNPRLRKLSVPTTMGELGLQGHRHRTTSSPLPGETHREMMERHAIAQQERQRRNSYFVAPTSLERMNSGGDDYRRRRLSSASSSAAGSRRSSVNDPRFRRDSVAVDSEETDRDEKRRNDFYLNLPLLI